MSGPWEARARVAVVVGLFPLFSIFYLWQALVIEMPGRALVVSPRAFPTLIGILLVAVSAVVAIKEIRAKAWLPEREAAMERDEASVVEPLELVIDEEEPDEDHISSYRDVALVAVLFLLYVLLFERIGFLLSTFAFLALLASYFDRRHWIRNLIVCALFTLATGYVFAGLLEVELPTGFFGLSF